MLKFWSGISRRVDYVLFNRSLHTPTNGELWLIDQLSAKPVVIDVGYNTGDFTVSVLNRRPAANVIAFDPARTAAACFWKTHGDDSRVGFVAAALSSKAGEQEFFDYGNMCSSLAARADQQGATSTSYLVPVLRLDDYAREQRIEHIDFLKIDAEGFDLPVLEGASELLARQAIDVFMFEYADGWIASRRFLRDAVSYLNTKPYRLYRLFNGFLHPFVYSNAEERFDLGRMFVGVSIERQAKTPIPNRKIID